MVGLAKVKKIAPRPRFGLVKPHVDLESLQAVLNHRYDLMAAYAKSLQQLCRAEAKRLTAIRRPEGKLLEASRRWLSAEPIHWSDQNKASAGALFAASEPLRKLVEMRGELAAIWARSTASSEQLLGQLQAWCTRAEQSGVAALQEISLRLRSYAA